MSPFVYKAFFILKDKVTMYKTELSIRVMINRSHTNKMPTDASQDDWRRYNASFKTESATPHSLAVAIWKGYAFAPVGKNNRRKKSEFQEAWHVALDFDTADERSALSTLTAHDLANYFSSFAYSTPSSKPDAPKSRLFFVFDEPITDYIKYELLCKALMVEFPAADRSAKDAARLFYGSKGCELVGNWSVMPTKTIGDLIERYEAEHKPPPPPVSQKIVISGGDKSRYVSSTIERIAARVAGTATGGRHHALSAGARAMGNFVGASWADLSHNDACNVLLSACAGWSNQEKIKATIEGELIEGAKTPRAMPVSEYNQPAGNRL